MKNEDENEEGTEDSLPNHGLPHWSEPGTGELPRVEVNDEIELNDDLNSFSEGPSWSSQTQSENQETNNEQMQRIDVTIGDEVKSDDFFSYEKTPDLAETTESIISEGKRSRRSGLGSRETLTRILTGLVLGGIVILCLAISKLATVILQSLIHN